jgi:thioredoxin reductase (NADPH)
MMENNSNPVHNVIILGSGPAGQTAALYAARAELNPMVITGVEVGGQSATTDRLENYPGFPGGVGGLELSDLFQSQAENFGAHFVFDQATAVDLSKQPYKITTDQQEYFARSLILTTGASYRKLGVPGEKEFTGNGVSYCATCDGWYYKDKEIVVVGGGDSALQESLFLTRFAKKITIVHRRDQLRASAILQNRARNHSQIQFILESEIVEIIGEGEVRAVKIKNKKSGDIIEYPTQGVFIFIGFTPNSGLYRGQLELDEKGYVRTTDWVKTSVAGVFAAGEIADPVYRQVVTSAGMGAAAAIQATHYLENLE